MLMLPWNVSKLIITTSILELVVAIETAPEGRGRIKHVSDFVAKLPAHG